jgi:hypothetical protein
MAFGVGQLRRIPFFWRKNSTQRIRDLGFFWARDLKDELHSGTAIRIDPCKIFSEKRHVLRTFWRDKYRGDCLGPRTLWEDSISSSTHQFTPELFLHVPDVHIYLVVRGKPLFGLSWPQNGHPRKVSHPRHFWVFESLQTPYMPYLHGFEESLNNQGIIRKHTIKIQILVVPNFFSHFFLLIKKLYV